MELPWTYSTQPNTTMAIELQNAFSGKKQRGRPRINIATVTKNTKKEMGLTSLDKAKTKARNRGEWKKQALNKYITNNFQTIRNNWFFHLSDIL